MSYKVFLNDILVMEKVLLIKANNFGVALKDDNGVTKIVDAAYVAEIDCYRNFVILQPIQKLGLNP
ncbi:hypothetical protein FJY84_09135 [Candidatus Bathyarchaeota archaeon]|nr:hypothetical protein [Candidatus Bathyarchaeota archaeon]